MSLSCLSLKLLRVYLVLSVFALGLGKNVKLGDAGFQDLGPSKTALCLSTRPTSPTHSCCQHLNLGDNLY